MPGAGRCRLARPQNWPAQLADVAGAGGVGVPEVAARQVVGVVAERTLTLVMLAGQPEHAVAVQHAPDGGEGIAKAEVDAADLLSLRSWLPHGDNSRARGAVAGSGGGAADGRRRNSSTD